MIPIIHLIPLADGTCELWLVYPRENAEFAEEFDGRRRLREIPKALYQAVLDRVRGAKVRGVKILVAGVVVATLAFSTFLSALAATDRYTMGYLYAGTDHQQIEYVKQTGGALDVVSPSYFDLREDGSLKLNYLSPYFIRQMHDMGVKVVPFLSNHWNRTAGIQALNNAEALATQIAHYVEEYDLDGVNVDIENVTHEQRDAYTTFVRLLREKIPAHKELSVAVAANPNDWQVGWHGSYDYAALARYADHLMIMAYDEHYEGSAPGPVASIGFVERSIRYALRHTTADKIVVGVPFYGRVWSLDNSQIMGKGASSKVIQQILAACPAEVTYDTTRQAVKAEFTVSADSGRFIVGSNTVLKPGRYVVWFDNDRSYQAKLGLVEKYNLKGAGAWSLGQEDTSIWENYEEWVNGESTSSGGSSSGGSSSGGSGSGGSSSGGSSSGGSSTPGAPSQPGTAEPEPPEEGATPSEPSAGDVPEADAPTSDPSDTDVPSPDASPDAPSPDFPAPETDPETTVPSEDPPLSDTPSSGEAAPASPSTGGRTEVWMRTGTQGVPVYQRADLTGKVLISLAPGTVVWAREARDGVYQVRLPDRRIGYVAATFLVLDSDRDVLRSTVSVEGYRIHTVRPDDALL